MNALYPFATVDPVLFAPVTPLAANASFQTAWLELSSAGDTPFFAVQVSSDVAGQLIIRESESGEGAAASFCGGANVAAGLSQFVSVPTCKRYVQLTYTNGATAQTQFNLIYRVLAGKNISYEANNGRILLAILNELRDQSMLLAALREPTSVSVNLPFGIQPLNQTQ